MREELERIRAVLEDLTGLRSNWTGRVELVENVPLQQFRGAKPFGCDIRLNAALATQGVRWRTLLHESLHALSAGYTPLDFKAFKGWEEGVVESLQQTLRPQVLGRLGVVVDEALFRQEDRAHPYNPYVEALEQLRAALAMDAQPFHIALLGTPIKDRHTFVLGLRNRVPADERRAFLEVLSKARRILEEDEDMKWLMKRPEQRP